MCVLGPVSQAKALRFEDEILPWVLWGGGLWHAVTRLSQSCGDKGTRERHGQPGTQLSPLLSLLLECWDEATSVGFPLDR